MEENEKSVEFIKAFQEVIGIQDMEYYYHVTDKGIGELICQNGLLLSENRLLSTTIPIDNEILNNPLKFVKEEHGHNIRGTEEIVIIGCLEGKCEDLIRDNYSNSWNNDDVAQFIIPKQFILGYIDMENLELIVNDNYIYADGYQNKIM